MSITSTTAYDGSIPENIAQQVQSLYVAYFLRPADPAGLAFWSSMLDGNPSNPQLGAMAIQFGTSAEYNSMYAQTSAAGKISAIYQHLFGRAAESAGVEFWANLLDTKLLSLDKIVASIASSAQFSDKTIFTQKTQVASAFTKALDTPAEAAAYGSKINSERVTAYLDAIHDDASFAAAIKPGAIDALIASFSGNTGPVPPTGATTEIALVGMAMAAPDYWLY